MKFRLRPHREAIHQPVRRYLHGLGGKPVHRVRLVVCAHHQRRKRHVHALRAIALHDEGIERVEGLVGLVAGAHRRNERERAALRGIDIDVVEVMEIGGIFEIAERRNAMGLGRHLRGPARAAEPGGAERATDT